MSSGGITLEMIDQEMAKIIDPELGRPITDLKLIDKVDVQGSLVQVEFHLTAPFCPPVFALKIASDIRSGLLAVNGVTEAQVTLKGHFLAQAVNKQVNKPGQPPAGSTPLPSA